MMHLETLGCRVQLKELTKLKVAAISFVTLDEVVKVLLELISKKIKKVSQIKYLPSVGKTVSPFDLSPFDLFSPTVIFSSQAFQSKKEGH